MRTVAARPTSPRSGRLAAAGLLILAGVNVSFRLGVEPVAEWDESLYANSAIEMLASGDWIGTTTDGQLDYWNSKPPLMIWILSSSFALLGPSLLSLRLASALAAWATIAIVLVWTWRRFGQLAGLLSALVLTTTFAFLHIHAGRSGNPDAAMTMLLWLTVIVIIEARERPAVLIAAGPLLAGVFLFKGMAVLLPGAFVLGALIIRRLAGRLVSWPWLIAAAVLFLIPTGAWAVARWQVDQWAFLRLLVFQDFVALSTVPLDGLSGSPLYYLDVLQRHHFDWLLVALITGAILWYTPTASGPRPAEAPRTWDLAAIARRLDTPTGLLVMWIVVAMGIPSAMATKLQWYLNPAYPALAVGLGCLIARAIDVSRTPLSPAARRVFFTVLVVVVVAAQTRIVFHSFTRRSLDGTSQQLLLLAEGEIRGRRVYRRSWNRAQAFVARGLVGADPRVIGGAEEFVANDSGESFYLDSASLVHPRLAPVASNGAYTLFRRQP